MTTAGALPYTTVQHLGVVLARPLSAVVTSFACTVAAISGNRTPPGSASADRRWADQPSSGRTTARMMNTLVKAVAAEATRFAVVSPVVMGPPVAAIVGPVTSYATNATARARATTMMVKATRGPVGGPSAISNALATVHASTIVARAAPPAAPQATARLAPPGSASLKAIRAATAAATAVQTRSTTTVSDTVVPPVTKPRYGGMARELRGVCHLTHPLSQILRNNGNNADEGVIERA